MDLIKPNASREYVIQSLQWCVSVGQTDILQALLRTHFNNSKLSDMSDICIELLTKVVSDGSRDLLSLLLTYVDETFLSNEKNEMGKTYLSKMLCQAVVKGNKSTLELLIQKGANVNTMYEGKPILHVALGRGQTDIVETLIARGADISNALIPTIYSNIENKNELVHLLLNHGADPNKAGPNGRLPIHVASAHSGDIIKTLVNGGSDINVQDPIHGDSPLHIACGMCCTEAVESLIKSGAKFNLLNNQKETPLHKLLKFATDYHDFHSQSRLKLAKFLIKLGFRIETNIKDIKRKTRNAPGRNKVEDVYKNVISSSKSVHTLQHKCRLSIRDNLHTENPNRDIEDLDIPVNLINYLKFLDGFCYNTLAESNV